jgi:hypothetical protein
MVITIQVPRLFLEGKASLFTTTKNTGRPEMAESGDGFTLY